ncbi:hypothetical protein ACLB2K_040105 [Fragaria x ananassa]
MTSCKAKQNDLVRIDEHEGEARWLRVGDFAKELVSRVCMHAEIYVQVESSARWDQKSPLAWKSSFRALPSISVRWHAPLLMILVKTGYSIQNDLSISKS